MTSRGRAAALAVVIGSLGFAMVGPSATTLARFADTDVATSAVTSDTLAPPTGLGATGGSAVTLAWTPTVDSYATGYDVLRGTVSGGPYGVVGSVTPGSATTTADSPGTGTWYYVLRSVYQAWSSVDSGEASATVTASVSTGYATCTTTAADTSGAGDNNGYQTSPALACADDSAFAVDVNSGTGGTASCGSGATPDPRKDRHRFWGFVTGLPGSVTSIDGISVRADLGLDNNGGTTNLCAQLSWDGGTTWTAMYAVPIPGTGEATYTFGGTADAWGRSWSLADFSAANFRLRLIDASSMVNKDYELDYVAISVTYTP